MQIELLRILHLLQTRDGKSSHEQLLVLALERMDLKITRASRARTQEQEMTNITSRMIRNAADFLAKEVCVIGMYYIRKTPSGVEWRQCYLSFADEAGTVQVVQDALDAGRELRPEFCSLSGDLSEYVFSDEAERIGEEINSRARELIKRQNQRNRDAALRRDPHAGADLVYVTSSPGF